MIHRPTYRTVTDAPRGFDLVQPKADGRFAEVAIADGWATLWSRRGTRLADWPVRDGVAATLVGEYLVGTQRARRDPDHGTIIVFDCVEAGGAELFAAPYLDRLCAAARVVGALADDRFALTVTHPVEDADALWRQHVLRDGGEGIILRRSTAPWSADLCRIKPAFERTESGAPRYAYREAA